MTQAPGLVEKIRFGTGLPRYLRKPLTLDGARAEIRDRLGRRSENFLASMRLVVFERSSSPYLRLFQHAGCTYDDLAESVASRGLETTLRRLRAAGIHVSLDEMRGRCPIERGSLRFHAQPDEFDALPSNRSLTASTSGSSGNPSRVPYTWQFIADEAAVEVLLLHEWGVLDAPGAFWMPAPPGISGIHNMLLQLRYRRPPAAWFSHLPTTPSDRLAIAALRIGAAAFGASVPAPRNVGLSRARDIALWLTHSRRRGRPRYVKAYASLAVRIAQAARETGESLDGVVFFCGGEPTTGIRRSYLESTGARVAPRYAATETGVIAGSCSASIDGDAMHLYSDRLAIIDADDADDTDKDAANANAPPAIRTARPLLFTSLLPSAGKILLNADLGDVGRISRMRCDCEFGRVGLDSVVSQVRSRVRYTSEGMSLLVAELESVVGEMVAAAGGSPSDYLIRESGEIGSPIDGHQNGNPAKTPSAQRYEASEAALLGSITILLDPRIALQSEDGFLRALYDNLRRRGEGWRIVSETWRQAGTLRLAREIPVSRGGKQAAPSVAIRSRR
jgi:hypothetical protein